MPPLNDPKAITDIPSLSLAATALKTLRNRIELLHNSLPDHRYPPTSLIDKKMSFSSDLGIPRIEDAVRYCCIGHCRSITDPHWIMINGGYPYPAIIKNNDDYRMATACLLRAQLLIFLHCLSRYSDQIIL